MNNEPGIADLIRQLRDDTTALVREEIDLAKTEVSEKLKRAARNVAYIAVAAVLGLCALLLLLIGIAHFLTATFVRQDMDPGTAALLAFLAVAVVAGAVCGTLASKGLAALKDEPVTPTRTARSLREDKQWAQSKIS